jgi:hypothetical protein
LVFEGQPVVGCEIDLESSGAQHSRGGITKGRIVVNHEDSGLRDGVPL